MNTTNDTDFGGRNHTDNYLNTINCQTNKMIYLPRINTNSCSYTNIGSNNMYNNDVKYLDNCENKMFHPATVKSYSSLSEYILSNRSSASGNIPSFLIKLWEILDTEDTSIVRWSSDGYGFDLLDRNKFIEVVLPKYFKTALFSSFQRQLNYFGFKQIKILVS